MKWLCFIVISIILKIVYATQDGLFVEKDRSQSWKVGTRHEIICRGTNKNQKIHWQDPSGRVVDRRNSSSRVYVQERLNQRSSAPVLVLVIIQAAVGDTGVWSCHDGKQKELVEICVIDEAEFVNTPVEVTVDAGGAITLICEARGNPEPRIVWYRNGEVIIDDETNVTSKYKVMNKYNIQGFQGLLTVLSLTVEDAGVYTCQALQEFPEYTHCQHNETLNINMAINYGPIMSHEPNDTRLVFAGDNQLVNLKCYADGFPPPEYHWYQQFPDHDTEIPTSMITANNSESILTVLAKESTFFNRYLCKATNTYGETSNVFKLTPKVGPGKIKEVNLVNVTDTSIILGIYLEPTLVETPVSKFEIMYSDKVNFPKGKPRRESDWSISDIQEITIHENEFSKEYLLEATGFEPETGYWVRVRAANEVGRSLWTMPLSAKTNGAESVLDEVIQDLDINSKADLMYSIVSGIAIIIFIVVCVFIIKKM